MLKGFIFLMIGSFVPLQAQLIWEQNQIELRPTPTDTEAVAVFKFQNSSSKELKVTSVTSSCDCTIPVLKKRVFAPKEKGELPVTFKVGERSGLQEKKISIQTDHSSEPILLTLRVHIPVVIEIKPTFLHWARGEKRMPKKINVTILNNFPVRSLNVHSSDPGIATKVHEVIVEKEYEIAVTPEENQKRITAVLKINTGYPEESPRDFLVHIRVR